ncbi:DUF6783 domain-containing protein [Hungatella effluvii]|uniref:DUF6783 domain-containing protein n=1 Tax=Hungatella effluvii TaxID=1096246 RepID=UPI00311A3433
MNVAHYASLIRGKSPANCDAHLAESNFQTHSNAAEYKLGENMPREPSYVLNSHIEMYLSRCNSYCVLV